MIVCDFDYKENTTTKGVSQLLSQHLHLVFQQKSQIEVLAIMTHVNNTASVRSSISR